MDDAGDSNSLLTAALLFLTLVVFSFAVSGCILDQQGKINQENSPPVIHLPPNQEVDTDKLRAGIKEDTRQEVLATSTSTAAQMTGAVNTSFSKLADKLTGLEANLKVAIENTLTVNTQASAELRAQLQATLTALTEIKISFKMITEFNTNLEAKISADASLIRELHAKVDNLQAQLSAQLAGMANGQVGALNKMESKLEQISNTAGHDINYLPKEAVTIMLDREKTFTYIFGAIMGAITLAIGWIGRNARLREKLRAEEEKEERQAATSLLMEVLAMLPDSKSKDVQRIKAKIAGLPGEGGTYDLPETDA